jgi:hypothetical protein
VRLECVHRTRGSPIEFEGPLRSVMERYNDVAVIIPASNEIINGLVGDYDRPFCFPRSNE